MKIQWKDTVSLFFFTLFKVPLLAFIRPRVIEHSAQGCRLRIPYRRRNFNHLSSLYFGVLCSGADLAAGWVGMTELRKRKDLKASFVFQKVQGEFFRRAMKDTDFCCYEGDNFRKAIVEAQKSGERVSLPMLIEARAFQGENGAEEVVAKFILTMSLKIKK